VLELVDRLERRAQPAARPAPPSASRDGRSSTKGQCSSREATARASVVLPVPGGPNSMTARGGTTPNRSASSGGRAASPTLLEQRLLMRHPRHTIPKVRREDAHPPTSLSASVAPLDRHRALEVAHGVVHVEPVLGEGAEPSASAMRTESFARPSGAILRSSACRSDRLTSGSGVLDRPEHDPSLRVRAAADAAAPTSRSPWTATTAWSCWHEAITSASE
jgi:hypothetical protein